MIIREALKYLFYEVQIFMFLQITNVYRNMLCKAESQTINETIITWHTSLKKNYNHVFLSSNIISVGADHTYGVDNMHHFIAIH